MTTICEQVQITGAKVNSTRRAGQGTVGLLSSVEEKLEKVISFSSDGWNQDLSSSNGRRKPGNRTK